jgi:alkaline phosphatase D
MNSLLAFTCIVAATMMAVTTNAQELPITTTDVFLQAGEVTVSSAIVMARCNSEEDSATTIYYKVQGTSTESSKLGQAYQANDFTTKVQLTGLLSNTAYDYRVTCTANIDGNITSSRTANFKTLPLPTQEVDLTFVWAADLAGQGWGRNPDLNVTTVGNKFIKGGYLVFEVMKDLNPDFALFQGDLIYADGRINPNQTIPAALGGGLFINNPSKPFVAITLDQFRANWKYNFGDDKMQSFLADTPIYVQWDDHEVINNWYPSQIYAGALYPVGTAIDSLYENSLQAFYEFNPILDGSLIYRSHRFGKHLEIFFPDLRSYRGPNNRNTDTTLVNMMGPTQLAWLKDRLLRSTATHKVRYVVYYYYLLHRTRILKMIMFFVSLVSCYRCTILLVLLLEVQEIMTRTVTPTHEI